MSKKNKKKINWFRLLLIVIPAMLFFLYLAPFDKVNLISVNTSLNFYPDQIRLAKLTYNYTGPDDSSTVETNSKMGEFQIPSDRLRHPNLFTSILQDFFDEPLGLGWHNICYHNINAELYVCRYPTGLKSPTVFTVYEGNEERDISVLSGKTICESRYTKMGIHVIINNKIELPSEEVMEEYLKGDNILKRNNVKSCPDVLSINDITAEVYAKQIFIILIIKTILFLLVWGGIILLFDQIIKFIKNEN